jgi:predicted phage-related endonuclease
MKRTVHQLTQGAADWLAHRASILNASEAPIVMGASRFTPRAQLLQQKATGIVPEVSAAKQALFDRGHAVEPPTIALIEEDIGDDLAPVVASIEIDDLTLGASYDGLSLMEDTGAEVKLWNEDLAQQIRSGELAPHYYWQLEQQFIVTPSLERIIFATSDGTRERFVSMEYRPVAGRREALLAGWKQFAKDLAAYVPTEVKEMPKAEVTLALPALFIHAKGEITTSNMKEYGEALAKRLADVRAIALITDQDFSNAKESAKLLRENIQQAKLAKDAMLAQTVTVGEAANMIDAWCEDMRLTALKLEQDVEREDRVKKAAMIAKAKGDYEQHIAALTKETGGPWISLPLPDWAGAIKGKRSFASMQDALDTMLANAKIAADESARKIRANLACLKDDGAGFEFLFNDRLALIGKPLEDLQLLVRSRIGDHRAAEEKRLADERERIRAEEQARADARAQRIQVNLNNLAVYGQWDRPLPLTTLRERRDTLAGEPILAEDYGDRKGEAEELRASTLQILDAAIVAAEQRQAATPALTAAPTQPLAAAPIASPAVSSPAANVVPLGTRAPAAPVTPPSLKLGEINERIAPLSMTAEGLRTLGFEPAGRKQSAVLYHEADFVPIVRAAIAHLEDVADQRQAA